MPFADKRKFFAKASPGRPEPVPDAFRERKRSGMKVSRISKGLLLGLAVLLATSAFAANKGSLSVVDPVTIAGKQLAAGQYKVTWDGSGSSVQLNIMQGKNVVATVPARVIELDRPSTDDSAVVSSNSDGSKSLSEIRFSGKKYALAIGEESASAATSSK